MSEEKEGNAIIVILLLLIAIMVGLIIYKVNFINIEVSGRSMVPTLQNGEELVAHENKTVERGDVIVVNIVENNKWLIKRVIGIAGDTIKIENYKVYRKTSEDEDFVMLEEDYIKGITKTNDNHTQSKEWIVGEGEFFFLGDNREDSLDSRYYGVRTMEDYIGTVPDWSMEKTGFKYTFNKIVNYPSRLFKSCRVKISED